MDTLSEIIHALLPVYLVTVLGTSMLTVGDKPHRIVVTLGYVARCIAKSLERVEVPPIPLAGRVAVGHGDRHG